MNSAGSAAVTDQFIPLRKDWDAVGLIDSVEKSDIEQSGNFEQAKDLFKFDMYTEFDAQNLAAYLRTLEEEEGVQYSTEFHIFKDAWLKDEWNHYAGYRKLYSLCTGETEDELHEQVKARGSDFGPLKEFMHDEFWICMVLAYDEVFTVRSCRQDLPLFRSFGKDCMVDWIKRVARDESYHFRNIVQVVRRRHAHRIPEAPKVLDSFIDWDMSSKGEYGNTFVLDHDETRYSREYLLSIKARVLALLNAKRVA